MSIFDQDERLAKAEAKLAEAAALLDGLAERLGKPLPDSRVLAAECRALAARLRGGSGEPVAVQAHDPAPEQDQAQQDDRAKD